MNIRNQDKEIVFDIDSYQFPWEKPDGEGDYDANWLMVKITYSDYEGPQEYTDPCLLTWELATLSKNWRRLSMAKSHFMYPIFWNRI